MDSAHYGTMLIASERDDTDDNDENEDASDIAMPLTTITNNNGVIIIIDEFSWLLYDHREPAATRSIDAQHPYNSQELQHERQHDSPA